VAVVDDGDFSSHKNACFLAGIFYGGWHSNHRRKRSESKDYFELKNASIRKYIRTSDVVIQICLQSSASSGRVMTGKRNAIL
jgi:hypothetical protein